MKTFFELWSKDNMLELINCYLYYPRSLDNILDDIFHINFSISKDWCDFSFSILGFSITFTLSPSNIVNTIKNRNQRSKFPGVKEI